MDNVKFFKNIDSEEFEGMYGGQAISLKKGEARAFTERIAKHLAGQLVHKMLSREGKDYLDDPERKGLISSMISSIIPPKESEVSKAVDKLDEPVEPAEEEFSDIKKIVKKVVKKVVKKKK